MSDAALLVVDETILLRHPREEKPATWKIGIDDRVRDLVVRARLGNKNPLAFCHLFEAWRATLPKNHPTAISIVDWAVKELEAASSLEARRQMLLVLGNAGSVRALPAIAQFLSSPESVVRATAASALRWIESTEGEALLLKALASDADASVRLKAAGALSFREMSAAVFSEQ